jgi:hypothetical protein
VVHARGRFADDIDLLTIKNHGILIYFHGNKPLLKRRSGYAFWIHAVFFTLLNRFSLILFGLAAMFSWPGKYFPLPRKWVSGRFSPASLP